MELEALKDISHHHICKLYQVIETKEHFFIIMEYCSGGELFDHIGKAISVNFYLLYCVPYIYYIIFLLVLFGIILPVSVEKNKLSEFEARLFFRQILSAVAYLHSVGYVHRDIKPVSTIFFCYEITFLAL